MRVIQHSKQLLLHLRLCVLLLLCYKNTSMHSPVQTFFVFFLYGPLRNDFFAVFQYTAYLRDCTSYSCGTKLAERPGELPGMLTTSRRRTGFLYGVLELRKKICQARWCIFEPLCIARSDPGLQIRVSANILTTTC